MEEGTKKPANVKGESTSGDSNSDDCYRTLVEHIPEKFPFNHTHSTGDPMLDGLAVFPGFAMGFATFQLEQDLEWMRKFVHIRPKGKRGRPKGTGQKRTEEAFRLWTLGYTKGEIRRLLKIESPTEINKLMESVRSKKRRLPPDELKAATLAHWEARRKRKPQAAAGHCGS